MHQLDTFRGLSKWKLAICFSLALLLLAGGIFFFFSHPHKSHATSGIVITANVPQYNFQVLAGSTRQINVQIANGSVVPCAAGGGVTCTVNWSVLSTTGGATATFTDPTHAGASTINGALPTIQVNIGPTQGNCSISGTTGSYSVNSTASITVQAQSVDDPTQTATFLFNVCANSPTTLGNGTSPVIIVPAYQQAYKTQPMTLQSWVVGCTNQAGHWSIVSQPSGGNGALVDTGNRDTVFTGSVTGRYTVQYTANCNGAVSTGIVYVSPNSMPSYVSTPNETMPHECYPDPALTGGDYEVGSGKQYATLNSTPAINTWTPGTIMRVWNTDTTGSNPSTYHEYFQVSQSGTPTQPIIVCGVPDAGGNLPIIDGSNATGQAGISSYAAGYAIMNVEVPGAGGYWNQAGNTARYISFTGLHLRDANPNYSWQPPGGGTSIAYTDGAACVRFQGQYIDVSGDDIDTCGFGLFSDDNTDNGWWKASQNASVIGNHFHNNGWQGSGTVHQLYFQTFYALMQGNRIDNLYPGADGADIKWRGTAGIFRYNYLGGYTSGDGPAIQMDLVDNTDGQAYSSFEGYINGGYASAGDTAGANVIAAYQEAGQQDYAYGNIFAPDIDQTVLYNGDEDAGMSDRNGVLYFFNNTIGGAAQVFRTNNNAGGDSYYNPRIDSRNNIVWAIGPDQLEENSTMQFGSTQSIILSATTNLFESGSISITTPITGDVYTGPNGQIGWYPGPCNNATCPWPLTLPMDTHMYGLTPANYLTTPTQPFDSTSYAPPSGSAAINAGTPLTGVLATMPVRYEYSVAQSTLIPRTNPLTIGAEDPSSGSSGPPPDTTPPTTSITSPANNATVSSTITLTASASDNVAVSSVQFRLDGSNLGSPDTTSPYSVSWNTASSTNGSHVLSAIATDSSGNQGTASNVTVTVSNTVTPPPDTTPPSTPTNLATTNITSSSISLSWTASTDNVAVTGYNIYRGGTKIATSNSTSYVNTGLSASTTYTYTVSAYDAAGNTSAQSQSISGTTSAATVVPPPDTTPPTTSITSPANNATISGTTSITANASDNVSVTSVAFYVDGVIQTTDSSAPYTFSLNTTNLTNGSHTLSTKAYDGAGNIGTSENVPVTVSNTVVATSTPTSTPPVTPPAGGGGGGGGGGGSTPPPSTGITSVSVSGITTNSAQVTITTNPSASIVVKYGLTTLYGKSTQASPSLTTNYVKLTDLSPNTIYDFVVIATPPGGTSVTSQGYTLQTSAVTTTGGGTTPTPSSTAPQAFTENLAYGNSGSQVTLLQEILYTQGFLPSKAYITGYFGIQTEHALLLFQNAHDLNKSGFVDTQTQALLNKIVAAGGAGTGTTTPPVTTPPVTTPPTTTGSGTLTQNLAPGNSGSQVLILQTKLNQLGLLPANDITGYYGTATEQAVKAFQSKYGIISYGSPYTTGYGAVGPKTRGELNGV